jgi:hypothetical protein
MTTVLWTEVDLPRSFRNPCPPDSQGELGIQGVSVNFAGAHIEIQSAMPPFFLAGGESTSLSPIVNGGNSGSTFVSLDYPKIPPLGTSFPVEWSNLYASGREVNVAPTVGHSHVEPPRREPRGAPDTKPVVGRRGRPPKKPQSAPQWPINNRLPAVILKRQMHNSSASRSRARFSKALNDLWLAIPHSDQGGGGNICRALKVEAAIGYINKLHAQLSQLKQSHI